MVGQSGWGPRGVPDGWLLRRMAARLAEVVESLAVGWWSVDGAVVAAAGVGLGRSGGGVAVGAGGVPAAGVLDLGLAVADGVVAVAGPVRVGTTDCGLGRGGLAGGGGGGPCFGELGESVVAQALVGHRGA